MHHVFPKLAVYNSVDPSLAPSLLMVRSTSVLSSGSFLIILVEYYVSARFLMQYIVQIGFYGMCLVDLNCRESRALCELFLATRK